MSMLTIQETSIKGMYAGTAVALIPATATLLIASSRAILINIIANGIIRALSGGALGVNIYGLSLIKVPFLWKISLLSGIAGGGILAVAATAFLANALYAQILKII